MTKLKNSISTIQHIQEKEYKSCSKCKRVLKINNFRKDSQAKTGFNPICKKCKSELYDKKRYQKTKDFLNTDFNKLIPTGKFLDKQGYVMIIFKGGGTILEHRWIMMKTLGRPLEKWEFVHHKNKNRSDNRLDNLELTPFIQHEHDIDMHEKSSLTVLAKENKELKKRIKELEKNLIK